MLMCVYENNNRNTKERKALDHLAGERQVSVSWVSIWETEMLERKGRITLLPNINVWVHAASQPEVSTILPVDVSVVLAQRELPEAFHADPADRLIVATSMLSGYPLAIQDRKICDSACCELWTP